MPNKRPPPFEFAVPAKIDDANLSECLESLLEYGFRNYCGDPHKDKTVRVMTNQLRASLRSGGSFHGQFLRFAREKRPSATSSVSRPVTTR